MQSQEAVVPGPRDRGRARGLEELYRSHAQDAVRLAYLITGDHGLAEDLAHDAFVRLAGRLAHLRDPDAFGAYLNRTVVNLARSHYRRQKVQRTALGRVAMDPQSMTAPDHHPWPRLVVTREAWSKLGEALAAGRLDLLGLFADGLYLGVDRESQSADRPLCVAIPALPRNATGGRRFGDPRLFRSKLQCKCNGARAIASQAGNDHLIGRGRKCLACERSPARAESSCRDRGIEVAIKGLDLAEDALNFGLLSRDCGVVGARLGCPKQSAGEREYD